MPNDSITLRGFFDDVGIAPDQWKTLESGGAIAAVRRRISRGVSEAAWPAAFQEVMRTTDDLLDIAVPEVFRSAWTAAGVLREYADPAKHPPTESTIVPLISHTIKSVHQPYIELLVADQPVGRVDFEIDLEFTLKGALLTIRGGKIVAIRVGSCEASGSMTCEGVVIARRASRTFALPGVMSVEKSVSPARAPAALVPH